MNALLADTWSMTLRHLRQLARQPMYLAFTLIQPIIWLLLFGELFERVIEIPGFGTDSYVSFLAPGVVVMSAMYTNGWAGMGIIDDLNRGVMDRFLVSPVGRGTLIAGALVYQAIVTVLQSVLIVGLGLLLGADFPGGVAGVVVLVAGAVLLGTAFAAFSCALALMLRSQESVIATVNFLVLPLSFLSAAFMQLNLIPSWMRDIARFNPVNWALEAGREALGSDVDWGVVFAHTGYLLAVALVCGMLATRSFRAYQRSI